jgi:hypothetical protein
MSELSLGILIFFSCVFLLAIFIWTDFREREREREAIWGVKNLVSRELNNPTAPRSRFDFRYRVNKLMEYSLNDEIIG